MGYALALTGDALIDLQELDPLFQEEVLDEIDRLAMTPTLIRVRRAGQPAIHDIIWTHGGIRHYAFLTIDRDDAHSFVRVLGIAHFARPDDDQ